MYAAGSFQQHNRLLRVETAELDNDAHVGVAAAAGLLTDEARPKSPFAGMATWTRHMPPVAEQSGACVQRAAAAAPECASLTKEGSYFWPVVVVELLSNWSAALHWHTLPALAVMLELQSRVHKKTDTVDW